MSGIDGFGFGFAIPDSWQPESLLAAGGNFGFTEHLIEYALGRPSGFTDKDLAIELVNSAKSKEFAVSEFIHSLVQSKAFRTK